LKWDFDSHGQAVPYSELGKGGLLTNRAQDELKWEEDFHVQVIEHAPHRMKRDWRLATSPPVAAVDDRFYFDVKLISWNVALAGPPAICAL
jgi:hypothetical protein